MKNKVLLENIAEYAKTVYCNCFNAAIDDDFANPRLHELNKKVAYKTSKFLKRPIKRIQHFSYVAALIYTKEQLCESNLLFKLNLLCYIVHNKVYKTKDIYKLFGTKLYRYWIVPGMDYALPEKIKEQLLEGVEC